MASIRYHSSRHNLRTLAQTINTRLAPGWVTGVELAPTSDYFFFLREREYLMPTILQGLKNFLSAQQKVHNGPDLMARVLSNLPNLEVQVNVAAGKGFPVDGKKSVFTDGLDEWYHIRIPAHANSEPEFRDRELTYPFDLHAEYIGSTGWDWTNRRSLWLGFDFDTIAGHAVGVGISDDDLAKVKEVACALPYVEVRRSTGGSGLHLYVMVDVPTENHTVHAALGRSVLGMMSSEAGFDFARNVDAAGGNLWFWSRKATPENLGFSLVKAATRSLTVKDIPANWRDNLSVVNRSRAKIKLDGVDDLDQFDSLANSRPTVQLDAHHKLLIDHLRESGGSATWVSDYRLLQTHTVLLQRAHSELGLAGIYQTISNGNDLGTPNCFLFPLVNGSWKVYRFSPGITEAPTWEQDSSGWTTCYLNHSPTLKQAARANGGIENDKSEYSFTASQAVAAAEALGIHLALPDVMLTKVATLRCHKDGRLIAEIATDNDDRDMPQYGWQKNKKGSFWLIVSDKKLPVTKATTDSNHCRAILATDGELAGWAVLVPAEGWKLAKERDAQLALIADGCPSNSTIYQLADLQQVPWKLVNVPFTPEYPGQRQWNLNAAQFAHVPAEGNHPTWDAILSHLGDSLTESVLTNTWCQANGIRTGGQWLLQWVVSMFKLPYCKLPFLFAWGPENSGKSIFWEAVQTLVTKGVSDVGQALKCETGFNFELAGTILGYVEEIDLRPHKHAIPRLRDWVTDQHLTIRKMRANVYSQRSTLHLYMSANSPGFLPFPHNDSRITVLHVGPIDKPIAKGELLARLVDEGPAFLQTILTTEVPPAADRLQVPMIATKEKQEIADNTNPLGEWLRESCHLGGQVSKADLFASWQSWADDKGHNPGTQVTFGLRLKVLTGGSVKADKATINGQRTNIYQGISLI